MDDRVREMRDWAANWEMHSDAPGMRAEADGGGRVLFSCTREIRCQQVSPLLMQRTACAINGAGMTLMNSAWSVSGLRC